MINIRVEYGFKQLSNTEDSISDIALDNGFPDSRSFAKAFNKRFGLLPNEYRKELKRTRKCH